MQRYTFSPITTRKQFSEALAYVVRQTGDLSEKLTGTRLKLRSVKVFAHYPEEFEFLKSIITDYGQRASIGRSTSIYVDATLDIEGSHIKNIGIRVPDPYRLQTGCGDYDLANPTDFVASLPKNPHSYVRPFPDMPDKFVELWHPDFDVAGYIPLVSAKN